jgi:hypothetical protein
MASKSFDHQTGSVAGDHNSNDISSQAGSAPTSKGSVKDGDDATVPTKKENLGQAETNAVSDVRHLILLVIVNAAACVCVCVFFLIRDAEEAEFKHQFDGAASKVLENFHAIVEQKITAISTLAVAITAHGMDHSRDWPFVTLSSFQERAFTVRTISDALYVGIFPIVTDDNRREWETFVTTEDSNWM